MSSLTPGLFKQLHVCLRLKGQEEAGQTYEEIRRFLNKAVRFPWLE